MPDEVDIYACLESPLFGGLLQVLDTLGHAVDADCAAGRVYGIDQAVVDHCTLNARLGLDRAQEAALRRWPAHDGSVFHLLQRVQPPAGICRPRDHVSETDYADKSLFRQLEVTHHLADCVCEVVELGGNVWAALCFIRCAPSLPFTEEQLAMLRRLHPTTQRVVQSGVRREMRPVTGPEFTDVNVVPLSQLLARLSRTECQILGYLRTRLTEKEIAEEVERSHHTIHVHVKNIYRKFSVKSRKQLMELFMEQ